jgi:hypothetical protein
MLLRFSRPLDRQGDVDVSSAFGSITELHFDREGLNDRQAAPALGVGVCERRFRSTLEARPPV